MTNLLLPDRTLSCGHHPSPHSPHTTGTVHLPDGEVCCACADSWERNQLANPNVTRWAGYLHYSGKDVRTRTTNNNGQRYAEGWTVTNWTGNVLGTVTRLASYRTNFGGWIYYFRMTDVHGGQWHGTGTGHGMFCRMKRSKPTRR